MFKADLIERAARVRSSVEDPTRNLASCPSLVLNADYTPLSYYPLSLWPWQTAIKAIFLDRVDVIETYDRQVHSPSLDMKIPSVIALKQYVRPSEFPAFTRFNLFLRDRFACQYCGDTHHLTFDHVIPRRLGGRTTWENIATACAPCNMKKGGRTPKQAGMHLATQPIRPTHWQLQQQGRLFPPNHLHETWRDWLYWDIELEGMIMRLFKAALLGAIGIVCASHITVAAEPEELAPQTNPQAYVSEAFALLKEHHINRRKVNWDDLRHAASILTVNSNTSEDTHAALRAILAALGENHSHIFVPKKFERTIISPQVVKKSIDLPEGKLLSGNIAYVSIPGLMTVGGNEDNGQIYRKTLSDLVLSLAEGASCGWIIDLRTNPGGNMWPMLNGLDPLLGPGPFGFFVLEESRIAWIRSDAGIMPAGPDKQASVMPPSKLSNDDAPIAVLMGPQTTSSGEMVAIALTGRKGSKTFGAATANFTTAVRPFTLSDGAVLGITTSLVAYRDGTIIDGPLIPDQASDDPESDAAEWLQSVCQSK